MRFHDPSVRRSQFAAQTCGVLAVVVSLLAIVGWLTGQDALTHFRSDFPPLPPNVAGGLFLLGWALVLLPAHHLRGERVASWCSILVIFLVLTRLTEHLTGLPVSVDHWLFRITGERLGLEAFVQITVSATVGFLCTSVGLLFLSMQPRLRLYDVLGAFLGVVTVVLGLAFLLGYVYGKPLGYGRQTAPFSMGAAVSFTLLGTGLILVAISHDSAERRAARRRESAQHATTRVLLKAETLEDALPMLLRGVCLSLHWPYAAFWQFETAAQNLRCLATWSEQPAPGTPHDPLAQRMHEYGTAVRGTVLAPGDGLPGQACVLGQPVWVPDLRKVDHAANPLTAKAYAAGLRAAYAVPIMDGVRCLGVLESFHPRTRPYDELLVATLSTIAGQIAMFIKRRKIESRLRDSEERTRLIIDTANDAFVELDAQTCITRWNAEAEHIFGWTAAEIVGKSAELIIPAPHWQPCAEGMARYLENGYWGLQHRRIELAGKHRDGHTFPIELTAWPIHIGGSCRFNSFISDITARKEAEAQIAARNNELQRDLNFAREFQEALLPRDYPPVPEPAAAGECPLRLSFHHVYQPTLSVSGDFFDVIQVSDHSAGVFIADVMGHGARSALVTAILRTLLQDLAEHANDPPRLLSEINTHFLDIIHRSTDLLFVSAFYVVLDVKAGVASYASAGHPSPLVAQRRTGEVTPLFRRLTGNPALGVRRGTAYQGFSRPLEAGDFLFLYTDGIVEAADADGEEFGTEQFAEILRKNLARDVRGIDEAVIADMHRFVGRAPILDDVCLVGVEVGPATVSSASPSGREAAASPRAGVAAAV